MNGSRWLLSCGHTAPMLEHERSEVLPSRPRMCERCGRPRDVEGSAADGAGELVCAECGARSKDGAGWRAELGPDDEGVDALEVPLYCPACWRDEFGGEADEG